MTNLQIRTVARYVVIAAREAGKEEHEVEAWATDARISEVAGGRVNAAACQSVRDQISMLVG